MQKNSVIFATSEKEDQGKLRIGLVPEDESCFPASPLSQNSVWYTSSNIRVLTKRTSHKGEDDAEDLSIYLALLIYLLIYLTKEIASWLQLSSMKYFHVFPKCNA